MSLHSSTLSALLTDFKARYPMGAIVAEFLTIHQDSYVVRALAQSGGITLASGMASAPAIEAAEDRAKIRALEALGIRVASFDLPLASLADESGGTAIVPLELPLLSQSAAAPFSQHAAVSTSPSLELDFAARQPISDPISTPISTPISEPLLSFPLVDRAPELLPEPIVASEGYSFSSDAGVEQLSPEVLPELPPPLPEPLPEEPDSPSPGFLSEPPAAKPSKTKRKADSASISPAPPAAETPEEPAKELTKEPSNEPNDRSNEIARISVEMKRLGWTTEQGRRHLKETYGKRSRQELNDSELMNFLSFLESQPSSAQSLF